MVPEAYARALLERLAITGVPDPRAIAAALKIPVHERALERCDGVLVRIKGTAKGAIAIKDSMREETRKGFTIAHELGHLFLPGHEELGICSMAEIESWSRDLEAKEREANAFAAELLMPSGLVARVVLGLEPSLATVERVAATFHTSLTASGYRFVSLTSYAVSLVWSQNGKVRWAKNSDEFRQRVRRDVVDARTLAADLFKRETVPQGLHSVEADAWLESASPEARLLEESRALPAYDAVLTILWARDPLPGRDETEELLPPLDPDEFSTRRSRWSR